jgi:hypothetical protein
VILRSFRKFPVDANREYSSWKQGISGSRSGNHNHRFIADRCPVSVHFSYLLTNTICSRRRFADGESEMTKHG